MALTFDGPNKLIILDSADVSVQEVYSRWVDWIAQADNLKYLPAIRYVGGDAISAVKNLGITYFMTNGWRIRPMEANHRLTISGNLYTDPSGESPFVDTLGAYNVTIEMSVSSLVDSTVAQLPEIQQSVFQEAVHIDVLNGEAGTAYPLGTPRQPVNNFADAKLIAESRGFNHLHIDGEATLTDLDFSGYTFRGDNPQVSSIVVDSSAIVDGCQFTHLTVSGTLDSNVRIVDCDVDGGEPGRILDVRRPVFQQRIFPREVFPAGLGPAGPAPDTRTHSCIWRRRGL